MKKTGLILLSIIIALVLVALLLPYRVRTVCFGDLCPDNGGTFLFYKKTYTEEECISKGGKPIVGFGWVRVYSGCSPVNSLSSWVEKTFNKNNAER
jgi:hypothetical protein